MRSDLEFASVIVSTPVTALRKGARLPSRAPFCQSSVTDRAPGLDRAASEIVTAHAASGWWTESDAAAAADR